MQRTQPSPNFSKGFFAGALAGLAGSAAMLLAGAALHRLVGTEGSTPAQLASDTLRDAEPHSRSSVPPRRGADSTEDAITRLGPPNLEPAEKRRRATLFHFGFGSASGALYGALAEYFPLITLGSGLLFGATFFLGADEVAVPAAGFSQAPKEASPQAHLRSLASHVVYGLVAENTRKLVRARF